MKFSGKSFFNFTIIMVIFACTGLTSVFLSGYIMNWLGADKWSTVYILGYIFIIFPLYHVLLLIYALIFGKYDYFLTKVKKLLSKINSLIRTGK